MNYLNLLIKNYIKHNLVNKKITQKIVALLETVAMVKLNKYYTIISSIIYFLKAFFLPFSLLRLLLFLFLLFLLFLI